ncbi:hypothetical protein BBP13_12740 [Limosilactobacillus reuteri]|nr:hypothetical protein BBP13_12740 [Limosilactobacillus reuteri]
MGAGGGGVAGGRMRRGGPWGSGSRGAGSARSDAAAKRGAARRAERGAGWWWCWPGRGSTEDAGAVSAVRLDDVCAMLSETSGGSRETDENEVAVKATGPVPESRVTTVTPAGWRRSAAR